MFDKMNLHGSTNINHPIVMTECVCNPNFSRKNINELLFECYQVPSVCYGIDALFSYFYHQQKQSKQAKNSLIIRSGNYSTHVLPFVNNSVDLRYCKRINIGGSNSTDYAMKSLQIKYPNFKVLTQAKAEQIKEEHCKVAVNYQQELEQLATNEEFFKNETQSIFLPYTSILKPVTELSAEELEQKALRKKQVADKMRTLLSAKKQERDAEFERQYNEILELKEYKNTDTDAYFKFLKQYGYENEDDMEETYLFLKKKMDNKATKQKTIQENENAPSEVDTEPSTPAPLQSEDVEMDEPNKEIEQTTTLTTSTESVSTIPSDVVATEETKLSIPAADQSTSTTTIPPTVKEEKPEIKEEKKGKRKRGEKRKLENEATSVRKPTLTMEELKEKKPEVYLKKLIQQRNEAFERIGRIKQLKAQQSQQSSGSRRKSANSNKKLKALVSAIEEDEDDNFGMDDDDWEIYNVMQDGLNLDSNQLNKSEIEEEERLKTLNLEILSFEQKLYGTTSVKESKLLPQHYLDQYRHGLYPLPTFFNDATEEANYYQYHLTVERIRIPEIVFEPSMIGYDNAGLAEMIQLVLRNMSPETAQSMCEQVYLCGGNSNFPQFKDRILSELVMQRPVGSTLHVASQESSWDAWKGASLFSKSAQFEQTLLTRKIYEEYGSEYFVAHGYSNPYYKNVL